MHEGRAGYPSALPGPLYCDTSALLKLYLREAGSEEFNSLVEGRGDILVSDLTVTEVVSALVRRSRQGDLGPDAVGRIRHAVARSLEDGTCQRVDLIPAVHRHAERLIVRLSEVSDISLRAGDALHLALAVSARAASFASFDRRLAAAARAVGLVTYPR